MDDTEYYVMLCLTFCMNYMLKHLLLYYRSPHHNAHAGRKAAVRELRHGETIIKISILDRHYMVMLFNYLCDYLLFGQVVAGTDKWI